MSEQFANHAGTTLAAAITSTARPVTFSVASATGLPASPNFRVTIGSEILLVTSISGTSLTGSNVEGTTPATYPLGQAVTHVITAGALAQLELDVVATLVAQANTFAGTNIFTSGIETAANGFTYVNSSKLLLTGTAQVGNINIGGPLLLQVSKSTGLDTTALTITPTLITTPVPMAHLANAGFGTTTPAYAVDVDGSVNVTALAAAAAPTITPNGTPGSTSYGYVIVAKQSDGSYALPGPAGSTSTGNATLSATNYNAIGWGAVPNATNYDVYRTAGGATQGRIATAITTLTFSDTGITASGAVPTVATSGGLIVGGALSGALGGWQAWTPTLSCSGSMTASAPTGVNAKYIRVGPLIFFALVLTTTLGGAMSTALYATLPVAQTGGPLTPCAAFNQNLATLSASAGGATVAILNPGQTTWVAGSYNIYVSGCYQCA